MTANREAFLKAIARDPDADDLRLIYADWLQDNGDQARAEFIRVQVRLAALVEDDAERLELERREDELLGANRPRWLADLPEGRQEPGESPTFQRAPVIWDAAEDRMASYFWKGGGWEPFGMGFEAFMSALFFRPEQVAAGSMWVEAFGQLAEAERGDAGDPPRESGHAEPPPLPPPSSPCQAPPGFSDEEEGTPPAEQAPDAEAPTSPTEGDLR